MKNILLLLVLLISASSYADGPKYRHQEPNKQLEFENVYRDIRSIPKVSSTSLPSGSTQYIQNKNSLQGDTTAYPNYLYVGSSLTVPNFLSTGSFTSQGVSVFQSSVTMSSTTFGTYGGRTFGYVGERVFSGVYVSSQASWAFAGGPSLVSNLTVNSSTVTVFPSSVKIFTMQLSNGDGALVYTNFLSATVTVLGSAGNIVAGATPGATQVAISKDANSHHLRFRFGSSASSTFTNWTVCFIGSTIDN